jgi:hypothetical protein
MVLFEPEPIAREEGASFVAGRQGPVISELESMKGGTT